MRRAVFHPDSRICRAALLALLALLLSFGKALAFPMPSLEEIEELKAAGQWEQRRAQLLDLRSRINTRASDAELLELIGEGYGLPPYIESPGASYASPLANLDGNDVVDERDVLELGWRTDKGDEFARQTSTTAPYGTVSGGDAPKILIVLIKFPDKEPTSLKNRGTASDVTHNTAWAEDRWLNLSAPGDLEDSSVAYYFQQASYGKLEVTGDVFYDPAICDANGWITSNVTYASLNSGTSHYSDVVTNAIAQLDPYVDFSDYDSNGDGYLDGLVTIYAGADNNGTSGWLWYFRWLQDPGYNTADGGVRVANGVWVSEQGYLYHFCHEFGHELGLPDLYDTGGTPVMPGAGIWTLMSDWTIGANGTGVIPAFPDAWCRTRLRWVEPIDVSTTSGMTIDIERATSSLPADTVFRLWRNGHRGKQCFLCEYRDADHGFDQNLPNHSGGTDNGGILVWHIDEDRTSGANRDNAFDPMRVALEPASNASVNTANVPWRQGYDGPDGSDSFSNTSSPNSKDNQGGNTFVSLQPGAVPSDAAPMSATVANAAGAGLPSLSIDTPGAGATVDGDVTFDVTSDATNRVEYWVNGCLKYVESGPGPYSGFTWDTLTALNGAARLRVVAFNAGETVRVAERTVTVANAQDSGFGLSFEDNFNSYANDKDPALLGLWNLHEYDAFGIDIKHMTVPGGGSPALAFAQNNFDNPPVGFTDDPNAGNYQGQDDEWLMTPRINLGSWTDIELKFKTIFRSVFYGDLILNLQVSADDGATWDHIRGFASRDQVGSPFDTGWWDLAGAPFTRIAQQTVDLSAYSGQQVYIRLLYVGGTGWGTGFAIDDFELTGTLLELQSVSPARAVMGGSVTLNGQGFGSSQGLGEVRFSDGAGGHIAVTSVTSWSDTQIVCNVPVGAKSHASAGIWVLTAGGTETNREPFAVVLPPPVLDDIEQR